MSIKNASTTLLGVAGLASTSNLNAIVGVNVEDDLTGLGMGTTLDPLANKGGLVITLARLGSDAGANIAMTDVTLGKAVVTAGVFDHTSGAKSLGDVEILGLNLNGSSIIIHGH